jgi:hypothetical protein
VFRCQVSDLGRGVTSVKSFGVLTPDI